MSLTEKIMKLVIQVLALAIVLYGLLCTVYSDVIIENDSEFTKLSRLKLPGKPIEKNLSEIIGETSDDRNLYIFVFDSGGKVINNDMKQVPEDFRSKIIDIDKIYDYRIDIQKDFGSLNLSKSKLHELFIDFFNRPETYKNDLFSIWTLGGMGKKQYPEKGKESIIEEKEIIEALKKISVMPIEQPNTKIDINNLMDSLQIDYREEFTDNQDTIHKPTCIIITFIFDLLHETDNKKSLKINDEWEKLREKIDKLDNPHIKANLIILPDLNLEHQESIYSLSKENPVWHVEKRDVTGKDRNTDLLFPKKYINDSIAFYYTKPTYIPGTPVLLNFSDKLDNRIWLSLLSENDTVNPRVSLYCEVPGTGQNKLISLNDRFFDADIKAGQKLKLNYNNRINPDGTLPLLNISMFNEKASLLVPVNFVKKLPAQAARIFDILQGLIIFALLFILILAVVSVRSVWLIILFLVLIAVFLWLII